MCGVKSRRVGAHRERGSRHGRQSPWDDGACTGEHGIGLGKKGFPRKELRAETLGVMRTVTAALDPL